MKSQTPIAETAHPNTMIGRLTGACATSLLPLLLLLLLPAAVQAQFTYTTNNGTVTITGYTGPGGAMTIPSTINGLPVTSIGAGAFYHCGLSSVTIPDSVTTIGDGAFTICFGLAKVTLGNSVTSIGGEAFSNCNLTSILIPKSVTNIGSAAFGSCDSLTNITVDALNSAYSSANGVLFNKIQTTLVQYPAGKTSAYTIPDSVTSIGAGAFWIDYELRSITIPNSVTNIGYQAFVGCANLTNVTIPNAVTSIGDCAFNACGLTTVTLGNGVISIGTNAFASLSLTSVTIPDSVNNIGDNAFASCTSLRSVCFLGNAPSLGADVFDYEVYHKYPTPGYDIYYDPATVYYLPGTTGWGPTFGDRPTALWDPLSQTGYMIINGAITITGYAGVGGALTIPDTINGLPVISIREVAFNNCTNLTSVTVPDNVTNIGVMAFHGCTSLTKVVIGNSVTSLGDRAFSDCTSLIYVAIPDSVTSIGESVFFDCTSLTNVTIGNGVTTIALSAFGWCSSLTSVTLGNAVTSIGDDAFNWCISLISVTIGNSATNIGNWAFGLCTNLTGVYFRGNAPSLGGGDVFHDAKNATVYYLPGTTGWGTTFADRPTALWFLPNPMILNIGPSFGVQTNGFGFIISWATNASVVVEASTNLFNPAWTPLATNRLVNGWSYFSDPQWTNYPGRFYRVRSQ